MMLAIGTAVRYVSFGANSPRRRDNGRKNEREEKLMTSFPETLFGSERICVLEVLKGLLFDGFWGFLSHSVGRPRPHHH